jgi:hypothetical protein
MSQTLQPAPTASMLVSSGAAGVFPTSFGYYPVEGSRVVQAQYNWGGQASYNEDLSQLVARGVETTIQSVYVDNSANPQAVTLMVSGTGQVVIVPPNQQGTYPLFFTGAPSLMIFVPNVGTANTVTRCHYLNVPTNTAGTWGTGTVSTSVATPSGSAAAGIIPVATPALAASLILKAAPGNLYSLSLVTTTVGGWVMVFDALALPANGVVTPKYAWPQQGFPGWASFGFSTPAVFLTGIVIGFSSTGPLNLTASATAFITGQAL